MAQEVNSQLSFWHLPTTVLTVTEAGSPNAYSSPSSEIYFGVRLYWQSYNAGGAYAPVGVLAHEFGHQVQFRATGTSAATVLNELEADAYAGYYLGRAKRYDWTLINGFLRNTYLSGNYYYTDPSWHGTPEQRVYMAQKGFEVAYYQLTTGTMYSYWDLHQIFYYYLNGGRTKSGSTNPAVDATLKWLASPEASEAIRDGAMSRAGLNTKPE